MYHRRCWGGGEKAGVEGGEGSSSSDSESYPTVDAAPDSWSFAPTRCNGGVSGMGERVGVREVLRRGEWAVLSFADSLKALLVRICPSFSILCSKTDHSRCGDRLKGTNIVLGLVWDILFPLRGTMGEETIRFLILGRPGRDCPSTFRGVSKVLPLESMELDADASRGWWRLSMVLDGQDRLRNKPWSSEDGCPLNGIGCAALEAGVSPI